jgi:hypothetical protein
MDEFMVTVGQLESYYNTLMKSIENKEVEYDTSIIKIMLDNRPIKIIRIVPFEYTSKIDTIPEILYMVQFVYSNEPATKMMYQLVVTNDGYGFSRSGRKYTFSILLWFCYISVKCKIFFTDQNCTPFSIK